MGDAVRSPGSPDSHPADLDEVAALRAIVEGTARHTGEEFFRSLVRNLSAATGVPSAFVAEFAGTNTRVRTIAYWTDGTFADNVEWDLAGTPCEDVVKGNLCHHPTGVTEKFPDDKGLAGTESYLGVPLRDAAGLVLGHLAVYDSKPMPPEPRLLFSFQIFAARAAAELDRLRTDRLLQESEERLRDLFDEAPIAYVHEDLDSRFLRANRTALRTLGLHPDEADGFRGLSLVPDTPEARKRAEEAFAAIGRGVNTAGVVIELRRKDDGRPLWIRWWSRPDPSGMFTRTMFLDITEQVLAERERARLQAQNVYLQEEIKAVHNFDEIVGRSPGLVSVLQRVSKVAGTDSTVFITGETGTGKELIARAVHSASPRKSKPLIKLNCASLPTGLVESEMFGHEKGAFTGATTRKPGRFELADGGTLFLDEIGDIPLELQPKLLRVLQEQEFERLGSTRTKRVNVRLVAATNRNLEEMVASGAFRNDLYYRLNVFPITLPPLRERPDDVPALVRYFVQKFARRMNKRIETIPTDAMTALTRYAWPGNVRELENAIERAVILTEGPALRVPASEFRERTVGPPAGVTTLEATERQAILRALQETNWVLGGPQGAAARLGLKRTTLQSRILKLGIDRPRA